MLCVSGAFFILGMRYRLAADTRHLLAYAAHTARNFYRNYIWYRGYIAYHGYISVISGYIFNDRKVIMKFILASQNAHKAEEFASAVSTATIVPAPGAVEVDENADSFIGNARLKARAYAERFKTNAIADDSGLCVDYLNGAPGIHSARYGRLEPDADMDPDKTAANNRKLLKNLAGVPEADRGAHFTCALCLVIVDPADIASIKMRMPKLDSGIYSVAFYDSEGREISAESDDVARAEVAFEAYAAGRILEAAHGHGGFGYDPLFYCPEAGCTFADLTQLQKLSVSHRGRAIGLLRNLLA